MTKMRNLISMLVGVVVLAGLAVGLAWLLGSQGALPVQQVSSVQTPTVIATVSPVPTLLPTLTPYVSETPPPVPTPLPTPVVTRIPVATPPFIPGLEDIVPQPFHILLREGKEVWIMNSDGSDLRLLVDTSEADLYLGHHPVPGIDAPFPQWGSVSPDGTELALVVTDLWEVEYQGQPFVWSIYTLDVETGEFGFLDKGWEPVWSPDGTQIAYAGSGEGLWNSGGGLWIADVRSGAAKEVFPTAEEHWIRNIAWSPDSQQIAFLHGEAGLGAPMEALIAESDGHGKAIPLRSSTLSGGWAFRLFAWSHNGDSVLYVSGESEHPSPELIDNLWSIEVDTTNINITSKALSADGAWIAFSGTPHYEGESYQYDLWVIPSDGSELYRLTDDLVSDRSPQWSPDGAHIVFCKGEEGLWTINLIDGVLTRIFSKSVDFVVTR